MNKQLKQDILTAIANNTVISTSRLGARSYIVKNQLGIQIISVNSDYDYGAYSLYVGNNQVFNVDKNGKDRNYPTDAIVREIDEVCDACAARIRVQEQLKEARLKMSDAERAMSEFLRGVSVNKK